MPITQRFVDEAGELLLKYCPLTCQNEEYVEHLKGEIEDYTEKFSAPPAPETVLKLAAPFEAILANQQKEHETTTARESVYARQVVKLCPQESSDGN